MIGGGYRAAGHATSAVFPAGFRTNSPGILLAVEVDLPDLRNCEERMRPEAVRRIPVAFDEATWPERGPVVLLVTADHELRESAALALRKRGYRVLGAAHAGHAVLACMEAGRIDVAAIELSMDDVSGPVLAERLRRRCPELRSLYLARAGTPECEGILVRPFTRDDLVAKVIVAVPPTLTSAS